MKKRHKSNAEMLLHAERLNLKVKTLIDEMERGKPSPGQRRELARNAARLRKACAEIYELLLKSVESDPVRQALEKEPFLHLVPTPQRERRG